MYQLPLKFIRVAPDLCVCATRVVAIMGIKMYQAKQTLKQERKAGTLINGAGRAAVKAILILDNGSVVSSPFSFTKLMNDLDKAISRVPGSDRISGSKVRAYDVGVEVEEEQEEQNETTDWRPQGLGEEVEDAPEEEEVPEDEDEQPDL